MAFRVWIVCTLVHSKFNVFIDAGSSGSKVSLTCEGQYQRRSIVKKLWIPLSDCPLGPERMMFVADQKALCNSDNGICAKGQSMTCADSDGCKCYARFILKSLGELIANEFKISNSE